MLRCLTGWLLLLFAWFSLPDSAQAQVAALDLHPPQTAWAELHPFVEVFPQAPPGLTIEQVLSPAYQSRFAPAATLLPPRNVSSYWLRLHIEPHAPSEVHWLLEIDRFLLYANQMTVFSQHNQQWIAHTINHNTPMSERIYPDSSALFPISLHNNQPTVLYLKMTLHVPTSIHPVDAMRIMTVDHFYKEKTANWILNGIFFGVLGIMSIYNLILFLSVFERSYIWFVGSLIGYTLYFLAITGVGYEVFWPERPLILYSHFVSPLGAALTAVASGQFVLHYLHLTQQRSLYRWIVNWASIAIGIEAVRILVTWHWRTPSFAFYNLAICVLSLTVLVAIIDKARRRQRDAIILLLAMSLLIIGVIAQLLLMSQLLTLSLFTRHGLQAGVIAQVTLLSLGLADRLRMIRKEKSEREKSDRLLHAMLPAPIAMRLKAGENPIADHFADVTVMFADIAGFTPLSTQLSPEQVVRTLNQLFSQFDMLTAAYQLEKIKTIGDCYMVVGGLPSPRADHAEAVADLALVLLDVLERLPERSSSHDLPAVQMRIGIHCGSVVAGVIGTHKPAYDIWGDTVNTASRMESHGEPGKIHCSAAVYEKLKAQFHFEERGELTVRGKGLLRTYFLLRRKDSAKPADFVYVARP